MVNNRSASGASVSAAMVHLVGVGREGGREVGEAELLTSQRFQEGAGGAKAFDAGWFGAPLGGYWRMEQKECSSVVRLSQSERFGRIPHLMTPHPPFFFFLPNFLSLLIFKSYHGTCGQEW